MPYKPSQNSLSLILCREINDYFTYKLVPKHHQSEEQNGQTNPISATD